MSRTDIQLKQDIEDELRWDPRINSAQIGVTVDEGAVSLIGAVDTYAEKWAAEDATKRVSGVRTIAQDLMVKLLPEHVHSDSDIAAAIQNALQWNVYIPKSVTASVQQGSVTLNGCVEWNYQRVIAVRAIRYLPGVVAVYNLITLEPRNSVKRSNGSVAHFWTRWLPFHRARTSGKPITETILAALQRQAAADAKTIHIETSGGVVTLTGHASSWQSIADASNAAWSTPGVTHVFDRVKLSQ